MAFAVFNHWISKFGILGEIITHFSQVVQDQIIQGFQNYVSDKPIIFSSTNQLQMLEPVNEVIKKVVLEAQMSWEDYICLPTTPYTTAN